MRNKELDLFSNKKEEYVEAEIVDDFSNNRNKKSEGIIFKIRKKFGKAVLFFAFPICLVLIVVGAILSSTIIGAIIGIPLIIIGFSLLFASLFFLKILMGK
ncbi:MAG TPA: hypothetical protein PLN68_10140 [Elusimicrobiales bacterium]|nr:hypothetical protein [Elusimicrobiales bacterium]